MDESSIVSEHYFTAEDGVNGDDGVTQDFPILRRLVYCVLVLPGGRVATGQHFYPPPARRPDGYNFDQSCKLARQIALAELDKIRG